MATGVKCATLIFMTNTTTDLLTLAVQGAVQAQEYIDSYANDRGRQQYEWLVQQGRIELIVSQWPDGSWGGHFYDTERLYCWDDCDGVLTEHRGGWCRHDPEHADFDCGCDGGHDEPPLDSEEEARLYGFYEPELTDGLGPIVDVEEEEGAWWVIDAGWDLDDGPEPDYESRAEGWFDEDYEVQRAEARYERWLGRS